MRGTGVRQNFVSVTCLVFASCRRDREFKKLRRQLQRKLHFKIELCVRLSVTLYKWAWRTFVGLARMVFMERQKVKDLLLRGRIVGRTWNLIKCTKKRAARAARLFFLIQPIKSLVCGADVAVTVRHFLISLMTTFFPPSNPGHDVNVVSLASLFVNMKGLLRMWRNCSAPSGESERLKD